MAAGFLLLLVFHVHMFFLFDGQLRFAMDYYEWMAVLLVAILLLIAVFPYLNRTVVYLRSRRLSPA